MRYNFETILGDCTLNLSFPTWPWNPCKFVFFWQSAETHNGCQCFSKVDKS